MAFHSHRFRVPYPYPAGPNRATTDFFGRILPPLPSHTPPRAATVYAVDKTLAITHPAAARRTETVDITIIKALELGYCQFSQTFLARVECGPVYLNGKIVLVKVFDPHYINPDDLRTADTELKPPSSAGSNSSLGGETLAGSVELSRTDLLTKLKTSTISELEIKATVPGPTKAPGPSLTDRGAPTETRREGAEKHFKNELRAYMQLREMEGKEIAAFLGHFTLHFPERDLEEDKNCRVLLLEALEGQPLATVAPGKLSEATCKGIREQVVSIVNKVHAKNIYFPVLYLDKFLLLSTSPELRLFGFSNSFNPWDVYTTREKCLDHAELTLAEVEGLLEDYGFGGGGVA